MAFGDRIYKRAMVSGAAGSTITVATPSAGNRIVLHSMWVGGVTGISGGLTVRDGAAPIISATMPLYTDVPIVLPHSDAGWFVTSSGADLVFIMTNIDGKGQVVYSDVY